MNRGELPTVELNETLLRMLAVLQSIDRKLDRGLVMLSSADRELLMALLPEISAAVGSYKWTTPELLVHASSDPELLGVIERALGLDDGTARRLGKLLSRTHGAVLNGLRIDRFEETREGWEWAITQV